MRRALSVFFGCLGLCGVFAAEAAADVTVQNQTKTYPVRGSTGENLIDQMNRHGPRHGFVARAIAQTKYTVSWDIVWKKTDRECRVARADAVLSIDYTYPALASQVDPKLKRRWATFMAGVRKHEETHGRNAVRMVNEAQKAATGLSMPADAGCRTASAEVKRRVNAIYARYEAKQVAFDQREHRDGGPVERLVEALARP
jgi:predicted secreted Zn-dependent protease